jgi:hypothetical protein
MWPFNSPSFNLFWTYLNAGSPSLLMQFAIANAVLCLLFIYFRGKKSKVDYQRTRGHLQVLTLFANLGILFSESVLTTMQATLQPFKGMLNFL